MRETAETLENSRAALDSSDVLAHGLRNVAQIVNELLQDAKTQVEDDKKQCEYSGFEMLLEKNLQKKS